MNIVMSLHDGSFDRKTSDDSAFVSPDEWREHFSSLLGQPISPTPTDRQLNDYIDKNCDNLESELGAPFTHKEYLEGLTIWKITRPQGLTEYPMKYLKLPSCSLLNLL